MLTRTAAHGVFTRRPRGARVGRALPDGRPSHAAEADCEPHVPRAVLPMDRVLQRGLGAGVEQQGATGEALQAAIEAFEVAADLAKERGTVTGAIEQPKHMDRG